MKTVPCRRSVLADILDRIRQDLAARVPPEEIERRLAGNPGPDSAYLGANSAYAYNQYGWPALAPLENCEHEAHTDNCLSCAPRWGWRGPKAVAK
jgi:hypothetical protein